MFLAHSSTFRRWVLSRGDTRGDAWWRKLERLTQIAQKALKAAVRKLKINGCVLKMHPKVIKISNARLNRNTPRISEISIWTGS